jgi:HD-like signal output (HDOD) protein
MTSYPQHGSASPEALKGKDDYVRTVLLTELLADHLPRLPWFLRNLQCALEDSSTVLEKVCAALEVHPRICSDFIRISCMAEPAQPIAVPIDQLVVLLGKDRVWTTVIAAFLLHELNSTWSSRAQKEIASIAVAHAYKALAAAGENNENQAPEQAYVSGILSIIGLMPLLHLSGETDHVPDWLDVSAEAAKKQQDIFGTDFLEIGRWARLLWKLPLDDANPEVMFQSSPELSYSQTLPKDIYSPVAAMNSGNESRNLVLVSKGTV